MARPDPSNFWFDNSKDLTGHCPYAAHRAPDYAGKNRVGNDFLDVKLVLSVTPIDLNDQRIVGHGFELLTIPDAGGDQQRLVKDEMKPWEAPEGKTWRAKDGGEKKLGGDTYTDKHHVLVISHPETGEELRLRPKHGIEVASITPDTNKNSNQPRALLGIMVKGLDVAEVGNISWRGFDEDNKLTFRLEPKAREELVAEEQEAKQLETMKKAATEKKKAEPKQTSLEKPAAAAKKGGVKEAAASNKTAAQVFNEKHPEQKGFEVLDNKGTAAGKPAKAATRLTGGKNGTPPPSSAAKGAAKSTRRPSA